MCLAGAGAIAGIVTTGDAGSAVAALLRNRRQLGFGITMVFGVVKYCTGGGKKEGKKDLAR